MIVMVIVCVHSMTSHTNPLIDDLYNSPPGKACPVTNSSATSTEVNEIMKKHVSIVKQV